MFALRKILSLSIYLVSVAIVHKVVCSYEKSENEATRYDAANLNRQSKGIGISAWGLVILILVLILLGVAAYYIALFYPLICKKERKYNRIELATV